MPDRASNRDRRAGRCRRPHECLRWSATFLQSMSPAQFCVRFVVAGSLSAVLQKALPHIAFAQRNRMKACLAVPYSPAQFPQHPARTRGCHLAFPVLLAKSERPLVTQSPGPFSLLCVVVEACVSTGMWPSDVMIGASFKSLATGAASKVADITTIFKSSRSALRTSHVSEAQVADKRTLVKFIKDRTNACEFRTD